MQLLFKCRGRSILTGIGISLSIMALTISMSCRPLQQPNHSNPESPYSDASHTMFHIDMIVAKQIGISILNYHDVRKKFPFAEKQHSDVHPDFSWRIRCLPFARIISPKEQFDATKSWDADENRELASSFEDVFRLTSDRTMSAIRGSANQHTDVVDAPEQTIMLIENPNVGWEQWPQKNDPNIDQAVEFVMNIKSGDSLIALTYGNTAVRIQSPALTGATREQIRAAFDPRDGLDFDLKTDE